MTRKHFEGIAEVLHDQYVRDYGKVDASKFIHHLATLLSSRLQMYNGNFKPAKFINACLEGKKMKNENGLTLEDFVELAEHHNINPSKIYLLMMDGNPVTSANFDEDVPELWYLGDDEGEY